MSEVEGMTVHALEMTTVRHVRAVAYAFLELLKDLKGYNKFTETPSYITVTPSVNEHSYLDQMIEILNNCTMKRGERGLDAFEGHYLQVRKEASK